MTPNTMSDVECTVYY